MEQADEDIYEYVHIRKLAFITVAVKADGS